MTISPDNMSVDAAAIPTPVTVPPTLAFGPAKVANSVDERIEQTLDRLEKLCRQELEADDGFEIEPPSYDFPAGYLVSIVIPTYNERDTIRRVIARVRSLPFAKQIIVVDDHSTDGTLDVLREMEVFPDLMVICKTCNEGKGAALRTGFQHASGDVVIVQDADLEYDPRDMIRVIRPLVEGHTQVVYGSRFLERTAVGSSTLHQFGNKSLTFASNALTGLRLTDMETCYKAIDRKLLAEFHLKQNRFGFEPEITAKIARRGVSIQEVPVRYFARGWEEGKKIGVRDLINALYCIVRYAWLD